MGEALAGMLRGVGKGYRKLETEPEREADVNGALLQEPGVPERAFPRREIIMGVSMFVVGFCVVTLGVLIKLEHLQNDVPGSAAAYVGLGMLLLVPGAYASCIAAGAWLGVAGFSYRQMPRLPRSA